MTSSKRRAFTPKNVLPKPVPQTNWHDVFIEYMSAYPNVSQASKAAGISRVDAYKHYRNDPEFAAKWDAAKEIGLKHLEDLAWQRAEEGSDTMLIVLLKANYPDKYRERIENRNVSLTLDELQKLSDDDLKKLAEGK